MENEGLPINQVYRSPWRTRDQQQQPQEEILIIDEHQLHSFIFKIYSLAITLCALSAIPWIILSSLELEVEEKIAVPPWVWAVLAMILLTVLSCIPQTPNTTPICWALVILCVFFITFFGAYYVHYQKVVVLVSCMLISVILLVLLHFYGAKAPEVVLPNILCTCCVVLFGMITMMTLMILMLITRNVIYQLALGIVIMIIVISTAPIQAMYNCGRLNYVPINETAGCANAFYIHFVFGTACMLLFAEFYKAVNT
ncbi:uncharacterized protein Dana_GF19717 [Drosophila ananassae]|uniref:Uncharacterized protein n=1 Tax=Drosophila ananassae TaxID=7217 RepID=B3MM79_DROAN|nr:uncharacterized protein LOC6502465 [Drosophila ananassae]EDV31839.1 uncharacterized protein Dana_GF19717 [Drosophila ananassae]